MPKVFVPQVINRYDVKTRTSLSVSNFEDAKRFGEMEILLQNYNRKETFDSLVQKIKKGLENVTDKDYFVPSGDPALISVCAAEIYRKTGKLNILRWDKVKCSYSKSTTEI